MAPQKAGRYELLEEVGRGAMGVVYRSRDPLIGRTVAVKTLRLDDVRQGQDDPEALERFQNEIRAAGRLTHPNIVVIHDAGVDSDAGLFYITMEFVQGRSLQKLIEEKQAFPIPRVLRIMEQACRALDYAHHNHIVHRDIKPANLLMGELDTVKITDFGTAKILERGGTQSGQIVGTPSYMSPEQVKGRPVDGRADVFALAVILYELLTGERPFPGKNVTTVIYKIVHEEPLAPIQLDSSIHPGLNAVILRGLSKEAGDRYASCGDFLNALRTYRESPVSTAQTVIRRISVLPHTRPTIAGETIPVPRPATQQPDSQTQFSTASPSITPPAPRAQASAPVAPPAPPAEPPRVEARPSPAPVSPPPPALSIPRFVIPEAPKRRSYAGWVVLLLLLAAGGAGAYFFPAEIQDAWHRAEVAAGIAGESSSPPENKSNAPADVPRPSTPSPNGGAPRATPQGGAAGANAAANPRATDGGNATAATKSEAEFPAELAPAKEKMVAQLQKLGLADRVQIAPGQNALVLSGQLTASEHRLLFRRLPSLPSKTRVIDQTEVPKAEQAQAPAAAPASASAGAPRPGEKVWETPGKGAVDVSTDTPGAAVTLLGTDGKPIGDCRTPCRFADLTPGRYTMSVKVSGYSTVARAVEVREGRISDERVHEPGAGKKAALGVLDVLSVPVGADILINGESTGRRTPSKIELPAGNYEVTLYLKGYAPFQQSIVVQQSHTAQLEAMLARQ
ncbi:MAG TPA: serine/threonine-protein kinase [Candidatus Acidoferrales bacterium]|nr:serine/threonine-protein kinase [Candidatus Acidoferrales bacterium]